MQALDIAGGKTVAFNVETVWRAQYGDGSVGYPVLNVLDFMKNQWVQGSAVMGALGIKTWEDLVKAAGKNPQGEAAEILKELFDSGLWLEELFKSLPIGYEREEPSESAIKEAFEKTVGTGVEYEIISKKLVKIIPNEEVIGNVKFVSGCTFTWEITAKYE